MSWEVEPLTFDDLKFLKEKVPGEFEALSESVRSIFVGQGPGGISGFSLTGPETGKAISEKRVKNTDKGFSR